MARPGTERRDVVVTGLGVTTAVGQGRDDFVAALLDGRHEFGVLARPGRQVPAGDGDTATEFLGAELGEPAMPEHVTARTLRAASLSARAALST
ncbi:MAG: polyketide beta-ketoacyl:ACP synthase, partial [Actinomycetota bacterium]|nr:polyketide beta-ketoacyl:ACP synthase [Actinomycetota bacterium]